MRKKALPTSPADARNAEQPEKQAAAAVAAEAPTDRCTMQYALPVIQARRFPSVQAATGRFIAEIATASREADTNLNGSRLEDLTPIKG
jgi:hypothetical protein